MPDSSHEPTRPRLFQELNSKLSLAVRLGALLVIDFVLSVLLLGLTFLFHLIQRWLSVTGPLGLLIELVHSAGILLSLLYLTCLLSVDIWRVIAMPPLPRPPNRGRTRRLLFFRFAVAAALMCLTALLLFLFHTPLEIQRPASATTDQRLLSLSGTTPFASRHHYLVVTPEQTGGLTRYVQPGPITVSRGGAWHGVAELDRPAETYTIQLLMIDRDLVPGPYSTDDLRPGLFSVPLTITRNP